MFLRRFTLFFFLLGLAGSTFASPKAQSRSLLGYIWGEPAEDLTIMPYMYDWHLLRRSKTRTNDNPNPMLAVTYKGFFAGTLVNSYSIRTYVVGVQRYWIQGHPKKDWALQFGYRLGLMYGYQNTHLFAEKSPLGWLCKNSPILPAAQAIFDVTYKHVGVELSWMDVVVTGSIYIRI